MLHASYVMNYKTMCFDVFGNTQYKIGFNSFLEMLEFVPLWSVMIYIYYKYQHVLLFYIYL